MKIVSIVTGLALCFVVALIAVQRDAGAQVGEAAAVTPAPIQQSVFVPEPEALAKKCSFDSDCPHGKCKGGQCGACSFNSDCKGWGVCKGGQCGACSFSSECKGFGSCSGGRCTKSPY